MGQEIDKDAGTVGVHILNTTRDFIDARAAPIRSTRSRFISDIIDDWIARGAPAVNPIDAAMMQTPKAKPESK